LCRLDPEPFEVLIEPDVGMETGRVFVKVQEGLRTPVEHAPTLLDQTGNGAEIAQQRL
jgi:hypothetical protein